MSFKMPKLENFWANYLYKMQEEISSKIGKRYS